MILESIRNVAMILSRSDHSTSLKHDWTGNIRLKTIHMVWYKLIKGINWKRKCFCIYFNEALHNTFVTTKTKIKTESDLTDLHCKDVNFILMAHSSTKTWTTVETDKETGV
jgi:hypothetical protein